MNQSSPTIPQSAPMHAQAVNFQAADDLPWERVQQLLQDSDLLVSSASLDESKSEECLACQPKVRELERKLLDVQQQLTVAIAANHTKNLMIDQLDKNLSRVVDVWKNYESDKVKKLKEMESERDAIADTLKREQEVLNKVEEELHVTLEKLMLSRREIEQNEADKRKWLEEHEQELQQTISDLHNERKLKENLTNNFNNEVTTYEERISILEAQLQKERLEKQQQEAEFRNVVSELEKRFSDEHENFVHVNQEIKQLQLQLEIMNSHLKTAIHEKETLKVEIGILEARNIASKDNEQHERNVALERQKQQLEEEFTEQKHKLIASHKELMERIKVLNQSALENALENKEVQVRKEALRIVEQIRTTTEEREAQLQEQLQDAKAHLNEKDAKWKEKLIDMEKHVSKLQEENAKLDSSRSCLLSRIQYLLQTQWQEALVILYGNQEERDSEQNLNLLQRCEQIFKTSNNLFNKNLGGDLDYVPSCGDAKIPTSNQPMPFKDPFRLKLNMNAEHPSNRSALSFHSSCPRITSHLVNNSQTLGKTSCNVQNEPQNSYKYPAENARELSDRPKNDFQSWLDSLLKSKNIFAPELAKPTEKSTPSNEHKGDGDKSKDLSDSKLLPMSSFLDNYDGNFSYGHELDKPAVKPIDDYTDDKRLENEDELDETCIEQILDDSNVPMSTNSSRDSCGSTESQFARFCHQMDKRHALNDTRKAHLRSYLLKLMEKPVNELINQRQSSDSTDSDYLQPKLQ